MKKTQKTILVICNLLLLATLPMPWYYHQDVTIQYQLTYANGIECLFMGKQGLGLPVAMVLFMGIFILAVIKDNTVIAGIANVGMIIFLLLGNMLNEDHMSWAVFKFGFGACASYGVYIAIGVLIVTLLLMFIFGIMSRKKE